MRRRLLALPAALLLLTAGCGDDDPEPRLPDPSPTVTSPPPTPPSSTAQPEDETPQAFIRRWQDAGNRMQTSGETSAYLALSKNCVSCRTFARSVERVYADGGSIETDGGKVLRIDRNGGTQKEPLFDVYVAAGPTSIFTSTGEVQQKLQGGRLKFLTSLTRQSGEWLVSEFSEYNA